MRLRQSSLGDTALNKTSDQLPLIIPMLKWFDCSRKRTRQASASAEGIACKDLSHDSGLIALSKLLCQLPCCILCWGHRVAAGAGTHGAVSPSPRLKSKLFSVTLSHQRHLGLDEVAAVWWRKNFHAEFTYKPESRQHWRAEHRVNLSLCTPCVHALSPMFFVPEPPNPKPV